MYIQIAAKRDPALDQEVQAWIESIIGEKFPDVPYEDALKNGVILCKQISIFTFLFIGLIISYFYIKTYQINE